MARRVSFKVAPGVRVSASSRGVRTSIGTNKARVSFGGGRTYTSAKVAGVRVSQNSYASGRTSTRVSVGGHGVGGSSSTPRGSARRPSLAQLEKAAQADEVMRIERELTSLHLEAFPAAVRQRVPAPEPTSVDALAKEYQRQAVKGIAFFRLGARRAAKARARADAVVEAARIDAQNDEIRRERLAESADLWSRLLGHEPGVVITAIDAAFSDNASECTCVDAGTDEDGATFATVVVLVGSAALVPEKTAALTAAGNPTLKKRTKSDRNALYVRALASTVLATVREALQTSPSTAAVRVVVLRRDSFAAAERDRTAVIYTATLTRALVDRLHLDQIDLDGFLSQIPGARLERKGAARDVLALDTSHDPELAALVAHFAEALTTS